MKIEAQKTYASLENHYWWFVGRRIIIEKILKSFLKNNLKILDWGCGGGGNFNTLAKFGEVYGVDSSELNIKIAKERGIKKLYRFEKVEEMNIGIKFNLVTCLDVLEHIDNDKEFLEGLRKLIKKDGYVLVTVPAYKFMWTNLDLLLGHYRRYSNKDLKKLFIKSGYKILKSSYFFTTISPPFILFRIYQKLFGKAKSLKNHAIPVPNFINKILISTLILEAKIINFINLPFGTSIILLAKKNDQN